ncbi:MAG: hypothetical protein AB1485_10065 [Candidatus Thermoplasmatota archaeon]
MELIARIVKWIEKHKIFLRKRKSNRKRALGMLLYRAGLSYRKTKYFIGASHEAVREWYQKGLLGILMRSKQLQYTSLKKEAALTHGYSSRK